MYFSNNLASFDLDPLIGLSHSGNLITPEKCPVKRTLYPTVTGTSVLGLKYKDGVIFAADTLGSYGSLARFRNCSRLMKVNDTTILGTSGDYADYQYIKSVIERKVIEDNCLNDGFSQTPRSLYSWLGRLMYNRRSKFDPLWNMFVVGGLVDGEPFLGCVDKIGTAYVEDTLATGYGAYIALPLLRDAYEKNENMTKDEAHKLLVDCMRVLYYRDSRALNKYEVAVVDKSGATIEPVATLDTNWDIGYMVKEYK